MESYESLAPEYIPNCYTYGTVNYMNQDDVSLLLCPSEINELTSGGNSKFYCFINLHLCIIYVK